MYTTHNMKKWSAVFTLAVAFGMSVPLNSPASQSTTLGNPQHITGYSVATSSEEKTMTQQLMEKAENRGTVRIIANLRMEEVAPDVVPGSKEHDAALRSVITEVQDRVLDSLKGFQVTHVKRFSFTPGMAMEVDAPTLKALLENPEVHGVREDVAVPPTF